MSKHIKIGPKFFYYGGRNFKQNIKLHSISDSFLVLNSYEFGFKALEAGKLNKTHLETLARLFKKVFNKTIIIKVNLSLIYSFTKKPTEVRMGKGKGARQYWECLVPPGMIIFEFSNVTHTELIESFSVISNLLPFKIKLVKLTY